MRIATTNTRLAAILLCISNAKLVQTQNHGIPDSVEAEGVRICEAGLGQHANQSELDDCLAQFEDAYSSALEQGSQTTPGSQPNHTDDPGTQDLTPTSRSVSSQKPRESQSATSISTTHVSATQSASSLSSSGAAVGRSSDSRQPGQQTSTPVQPSLTTESQLGFPTSGILPSLLPSPNTQATGHSHIPIGPIVGAITPVCILLIGIFIYFVRRRRMMKPAPWVSELTPTSPSGNRLKQPLDPEKRLLSAHLDRIERNDEAVDHPGGLCPPAFPTDSHHVVADNDLESRLRGFIRDRYRPSLPSGSPSQATSDSDQPPPY